MKVFQKIYNYSSVDGKILTAYDKNGEEIYRNSYGNETWFLRNNGLLTKIVKSDGLVVNRVYNAEGKLILVKDNKGFEDLYEYNPEGKVIHTQNTKGYEQWWKYDQNGHLKSYKDSNGKEKRYEHSPEGKLLSSSHLRDGKPLEIYHYDDWGNEIYCKDNIAHIEQWWAYNDNGKRTSYKNSDGEQWVYKHDKKGRLVITEKNDGFREEITYDRVGRILSIKNPGLEEIYEYDKRGNQIYLKRIYPDEPSIEEWQEFNDQNQLIHFKNNSCKELWHTYDVYGNETSKREFENGKIQWAVKTKYLYHEQLTEDTEWLFPFEELK